MAEEPAPSFLLPRLLRPHGSSGRAAPSAGPAGTGFGKCAEGKRLLPLHPASYTAGQEMRQDSLLGLFSSTLYNAFPFLMEIGPGQHQRISCNWEAIKQFVREQISCHLESDDLEEPLDFMDC